MTKIPTLLFLPSPPPASTNSSHGYRRIEREVNRQILLEMEPDRQELFSSKRSIEEIRHLLAVRTGDDTGHWLYSAKDHKDTAIETLGVSRDAQLSPSQSHTGDAPVQQQPPSLPSSPTLPNSQDLKGKPASSAEQRQKLHISIVPTHILLVHPMSSPTLKVAAPIQDSAVPLPQKKGKKENESAPPSPSQAVTSTTTTHMLPSVASPGSRIPFILELPINDLLFVMNMPNLFSFTTSDDNPKSRIPFPARIPDQLPYVSMSIPKLETFKELVVYLHNKNQAELFQSLIPDWIIDLLHPLPRFDGCSCGGCKGSLSKSRPRHGLKSGSLSYSRSFSSTYSSSRSLSLSFPIQLGISLFSSTPPPPYGSPPSTLFLSKTPTPVPSRPNTPSSDALINTPSTRQPNPTSIVQNRVASSPSPFSPTSSSFHTHYASPPHSSASSISDALSNVTSSPPSRATSLSIPKHLFRRRGLSLGVFGAGIDDDATSPNPGSSSATTPDSSIAPRGIAKLFPTRRGSLSSLSTSSTKSRSSSRRIGSSERSLDSVAREIAQVARSISQIPLEGDEEELGDHPRITSPCPSEEASTIIDDARSGVTVHHISSPATSFTVPKYRSRSSTNQSQVSLPPYYSTPKTTHVPHTPPPPGRDSPAQYKTSFASNKDSVDPLIHAASLLDALRDNLDYIGYYNPVLWHELEVSREVLIRAVSWAARIDADD
ncbi:hypothetical protein AX16_009090 [Volvariella volvacea WC 439]|nr:hypothetical protein AX16_009090 [Volvariella volvacea WC 439]